MAQILDELADLTLQVIESVGSALPRRFPERVFASITGGLPKLIGRA